MLHYTEGAAWGQCNEKLISCLMQVQEAEASNQLKCEAVCAVGRLVAFQSVAAGDWLAPQLISHMVGHGKQVNLLLPECPLCLWCHYCVLLQHHWSDVSDNYP